MKRTLARSDRQDATIHSYAFPLIAQDVYAKLIVNVSNYFACQKSKPHSRNEARRRRVGVATPNRPSGFRDLNAGPTGSQITPNDRGGRHARQSRSATPAGAGELPLRAVMPISGRQSNDGYDLDRGPSQGDPRRRTSAHLRRPRPRPAMSAQRRHRPDCASTGHSTDGLANGSLLGFRRLGMPLFSARSTALDGVSWAQGRYDRVD
jgi:hypothetical protein